MPDPAAKPRWYRFTPDHLIVLLLVAEALLWLSNWLGWPRWHKGYAVLTCLAMMGGTMIVMLAWFLAALVFRRRFQFGILSLLVLAVAVALSSSWLAVEMGRAKQQAASVVALRQHDVGVGYDWEFGTEPFPRHPPGPIWLHRLLGDDFFGDVVWVIATGTEANDECMEYLTGLPQVVALFLEGTKVTDAGLEKLKCLSRLGRVYLEETKTTGAGVQDLQQALPSCNIYR